MVDAEDFAELTGEWWPELAGVALALAGAALAYRASDPVRGVLALALLVALVDRIRLRLDNRSLSEQVREFQGRLREEAAD